MTKSNLPAANPLSMSWMTVSALHSSPSAVLKPLQFSSRPRAAKF
ncbi:hypothetical protein [Nonomuraea typhae]|uniref:Uncharacterized protein n=1 Tax=Nonomuraea typhae TaxID=2603600 RepID=A0ABW7Z8H9_9ACTN